MTEKTLKVGNELLDLIKSHERYIFNINKALNNCKDEDFNVMYGDNNRLNLPLSVKDEIRKALIQCEARLECEIKQLREEFENLK